LHVTSFVCLFIAVYVCKCVCVCVCVHVQRRCLPLSTTTKFFVRYISLFTTHMLFPSLVSVHNSPFLPLPIQPPNTPFIFPCTGGGVLPWQDQGLPLITVFLDMFCHWTLLYQLVSLFVQLAIRSCFHYTKTGMAWRNSEMI